MLKAQLERSLNLVGPSDMQMICSHHSVQYFGLQTALIVSNLLSEVIPHRFIVPRLINPALQKTAARIKMLMAAPIAFRPRSTPPVLLILPTLRFLLGVMSLQGPNGCSLTIAKQTTTNLNSAWWMSTLQASKTYKDKCVGSEPKSDHPIAPRLIQTNNTRWNSFK